MRVETLYKPWETIAHMKKKWLVIGLGLMACGCGTVLADEAVSQALRERVERLRETGQLTVDNDGTVRFEKDIYERDQRIGDGLKAPFRVSPPRA